MFGFNSEAVYARLLLDSLNKSYESALQTHLDCLIENAVRCCHCPNYYKLDRLTLNGILILSYSDLS